MEQSQYGDPSWVGRNSRPEMISSHPLYCHVLSAGAQDVIVFRFARNLSILKIWSIYVHNFLSYPDLGQNAQITNERSQKNTAS